MKREKNKDTTKNTNKDGGINMTTITTVKKWGNSLAIRIPQIIAESVHVYDGKEVELTVSDQEIRITPKKEKPTLEELLEKITPQNRHNEIDFGREGKELI